MFLGIRSASTARHILCRQYTAAAAVKPDIKLLKQLRQETEVSMTKAKEALVKNSNDYAKALAWLEQDAQAAGAKKAQKVAGRTAGEGLISVASVVAEGAPRRSTMIELNCETDFVSRNDVFKNLASRIAATSLLLHDSSKAIEQIPVDSLLQAPLMPHPDDAAAATADAKSIQEAIVETIGKLGENITLRRAAVASGSAIGQYVHGGDAAAGKMGGFAVLEPRKVASANAAEALDKVARQVARQVVGYNPQYLNEQDVPAGESASVSECVLTKQPFMLNPDLTVAEHVDKAAKDAGLEDGAAVAGFLRWEVGEGIEKKENDFASEVQKAAQGN